MNATLRTAYLAELDLAGAALARNEPASSFHHLERAHILGQRHTVQHVYVHWRMLKLGIAVGDRREIFGQMVRIVAAALFSRLWIPVGNTGRANVGALQPMAVPEDLRAILDRSGP